MARDVMRHRLVLSFEALSDDVTADAHPDHGPAHACPPRPSRRRSSRTSTSAPERILQRLDWQVVRRLDGLLQGDYRSLFRGYGVDLADLREYQSGRRRPLHRLERHRADGRAVRARVHRGPRAHRLVPARPEPVGRLRHGRGGPPEADRPHRLRDDARPAPDPARQPGRRRAVRRPASSGRSRPAAGRIQVLRLIDDLLAPAAPRRARRSPTCGRCSTPATQAIKRRSLVFVISDFISEPGWERSLELLTRRHEVLAIRLVDPREVDAARRRAAHPRGRRDRRAALRRHRRPGVPPPVRGRRPTRARRRSRAAFRRAGVEAVTLSTDEDLVRAIVRMATLRDAGGGAGMTFLWPQALLAARARSRSGSSCCAPSTGAPADGGGFAGGGRSAHGASPVAGRAGASRPRARRRRSRRC